MRVYAPSGTAGPLLGRNPKTIALAYAPGGFGLTSGKLNVVDYTVPAARAAQLVTTLSAIVAVPFASGQSAEIDRVVKPAGGTNQLLMMGAWNSPGLEAILTMVHSVPLVLQAGDEVFFQSTWGVGAGRITLIIGIFGTEYDA